MMVIADDILICSKSKQQMEENLEKWLYVLEIRRMKGVKWNCEATEVIGWKRSKSLKT